MTTKTQDCKDHYHYEAQCTTWSNCNTLYAIKFVMLNTKAYFHNVQIQCYTLQRSQIRILLVILLLFTES